MESLHIFAIFIVVLFVYVHVQFQLKTSTDTNVFELDGVIENRIDDVLNLKQPVVFRAAAAAAPNSELLDAFTKNGILAPLKGADINVARSTGPDCPADNIRISASIESSTKLFDTEDKYYSDRNGNAMKRLPAATLRTLCTHTEQMKPPFCSKTSHDMIFGTQGATTRLQYSIMFRNYFTATNGTVHVKLIPPTTLPDLAITPDYYDMEFSTAKHIWSDNAPDAAKWDVKDVTLYKGQTLSVPPYWGYTIRLTTPNAFVVSTKYTTYMTDMATIHHTALHWLHWMTQSGATPTRHESTKDDIAQTEHGAVETETEAETETETETGTETEAGTEDISAAQKNTPPTTSKKEGPQ